MSFTWSLAILMLLAMIPPLTPDQRAQLATANDGGALLDQGALYPLLENAMQWPAHTEAAARIPDYASIEAHPADHRGELFLIEGEFGRGQQVTLARSGSWGSKVTQWDIRVQLKPERVAVVYLVAPPDQLPKPRMGEQVRLAARFYKIWGGHDLRNRPTAYPVFVGKGAKVIAGVSGSAHRLSNDPGVTLWVLAPLIFLLLATFFVLRYVVRTNARVDTFRHSRQVSHRSDADITDDDEHDGQDLSDDAAQALDELTRRRDMR